MKTYLGLAGSYKGETADADIIIDAAGADQILDIYQEHGKVDSREDADQRCHSIVVRQNKSSAQI
jgi:hypothetical protein